VAVEVVVLDVDAVFPKAASEPPVGMLPELEELEELDEPITA
jgi:hypothetical protein